MLAAGDRAPPLRSTLNDGKAWLAVLLETDCPTCRLAVPYLSRLAEQGAHVVGPLRS